MTMPFKLMIIDDAKDREELYQNVLSTKDFDPLYIWTPADYYKHRDTPVDGYIIDIFLDKNGWNQNAANLLQEISRVAPRPAPIFLVSQLWGEEKILEILKKSGEFLEPSFKVVQYLAWSEFHQANGNDATAQSRMEALQKKIWAELCVWHRRSGFRPAPNDPIRILLLSDLQFGDPNTDPESTFSEEWIGLTLRRNNHLPDLIVIAGDISYSGSPDQFELARTHLESDLIGFLWGKNKINQFRDRIIIAPGNHDVNLRFSACDNYEFNLKTKKLEEKLISHSPLSKADNNYCHHSYALAPFRRFAHQLTGDRNWLDSYALSWVDRRFLHCGICFFIINSVNELTSSEPANASFDKKATLEISRSLGTEDLDSIFNIAVSHHGIRPDGASDKETQMNDWYTVGREFFSMRKIRLWLYGHYHEYNVRSLNSKPFDEVPLWLVQSPTAKINYKTRGFCLIELCRQAGIVNNAFAHHYVYESGSTNYRGKRQIFGKG